jgi:hypothetical protein
VTIKICYFNDRVFNPVLLGGRFAIKFMLMAVEVTYNIRMIDELEEMWKEMHFIMIDLFMSVNRIADEQERQIMYNIILMLVHVIIVAVEKK